uniref:Lipoprotein n=1 Tax=Steinernema glaseri TaxID=37863 RepID=A0A1I7YFP5_9BILA
MSFVKMGQDGDIPILNGPAQQKQISSALAFMADKWDAFALTFMVDNKNNMENENSRTGAQNDRRGYSERFALY